MKENMYNWIDVKINYIQGECPHGCLYCYVNWFRKRFPLLREKYSGNLRLDWNAFEKLENWEKIVFVQDCGDLFADAVPSEWIKLVLGNCKLYNNTYFYQTKNPKRFLEFLDDLPPKCILGTTIETNRDYKVSFAPPPFERYEAFNKIPKNFQRMINIEPIMEFDMDELLDWIINISPNFVSIGADSKGNKLKEPKSEKIMSLIEILKASGIKVLLKHNLNRLVNLESAFKILSI